MLTDSIISPPVGTNRRSSSPSTQQASRRTSAARPYKALLMGLFQRLLILCLIICLTFSSMPEAWAQVQPQLLKQATDTSAPEAMAADEIASLNDPFFNLVLKDHLDTQTVNSITERLGPERQSAFVVHERIVDDAKTVGGGPASRRSVITFDGETEGETLSNNVMLSVFFNAESYPSFPDIEAMAWDETNGQFNYYKLNEARGEEAPSWKFRGDSKDADLLSVSAREGTCMACHINGGLVMKEFKAPWNNWHSRDLDIGYLRDGDRNEWDVVDRSLLKDNLTGALPLEFTTSSANQRLNERRLDGLVRGDRVRDAKRLLKPLFVTTEFNLMSSFDSAGTHPFGDDRPSSNQIFLPTSFFLNSDLMGRIGVDSFDFSNITSLESREYQAVVNRGKTRLGNQDGDTHFAWFTPEASDIDTAYVSKLINDGIVPESFVAAGLAVDLETPVLSSDRARLWSTNNILPSEFRTGGNDLTAQTIRNLEQLNPSSDSPEGQFLEALQSPNPVQFLQAKVDQYIEQERRRFDNPQTRTEEIGRLYRKLLVEREKVKDDGVLSHLIESPLLFPTGDIAALPETVTDPTPQPNRPTLALGDQGDAVEDLQRLLQQQGFLSGPIDGDFGPGTERAVLAAQRQLGLEADSIVGPATWAALEGMVSPQPPADLPVLRQGDRGDNVVFLQQLLRDQGFLFGRADGDFGGLTRAAVIRAQRRFGLDPDGIVGSATWGALGA